MSTNNCPVVTESALRRCNHSCVFWLGESLGCSVPVIARALSDIAITLNELKEPIVQALGEIIKAHRQARGGMPQT